MCARPILADEIERFVEAAEDPEHSEDVRDYLESMFAAGSMRPEWCYVVEDAGRACGRVALWPVPRRPGYRIGGPVVTPPSGNTLRSETWPAYV